MNLRHESEQALPRDNAAGQRAGRMFSIALPINYEDTDAGGVVYYGNYLGYMERARNAWLRSLGLPLSRLRAEHGVVFAVAAARLSYLAPAVLDDQIEVTLKVANVGAASVWFDHQVLRDAACLLRAAVRLATVKADTFRPCRLPADLRARLRRAAGDN